MNVIKIKMNILFLIISNDSLSHYKHNKKVWEMYMNNCQNIDCYFIENENNDENNVKNTNYPYTVNNTIYCKGEELFENIIIKTINAMEYCTKKKTYDFVVRTNLSSVWDMDKLQSYLQTLPKTNIYTGPRGPYYHLKELYFMFYFVGGMGIIMSIDTCKLLVDNRNMAESFKNMDDIDIGYTMNQLNIPILPINYYDVNSMVDFEEKQNMIKNREQIFYRCKCNTENRDDEPIYMSKIVKLLYK